MRIILNIWNQSIFLWCVHYVQITDFLILGPDVACRCEWPFFRMLAAKVNAIFGSEDSLLSLSHSARDIKHINNVSGFEYLSACLFMFSLCLYCHSNCSIDAIFCAFNFITRNASVGWISCGFFFLGTKINEVQFKPNKWIVSHTQRHTHTPRQRQAHSLGTLKQTDNADMHLIYFNGVKIS